MVNSKVEKVVMVDMMNTFIRSFASLPLTNDNGEHVGGVYGTLQSINSIIKRFNPDAVYIAWEGKGSSERRRKLLKEYKEGRRFTGFNRHFETSNQNEKESFRDQLMLTKKILNHLPVYQASVDYLEADDLIAYLCTTLLKNNYEKTIISTDRDYWQLVNDNTKVFRPVKKKGNSSGEIISYVDEENKRLIAKFNPDTNECIEVLNIHPSNYLLTKCFGEPSDNIDGIKGIGEKTILKDFPFLVSLKENGDIYTISDLVEYARNNADKLQKYKKYILPENVELLQRNEKLIQLLEPNISLKARDTIINNIGNTDLKINTVKFRLEMKSQGISPRNIDTWISNFKTLSTNNIVI